MDVSKVVAFRRPPYPVKETGEVSEGPFHVIARRPTSQWGHFTALCGYRLSNHMGRATLSKTLNHPKKAMCKRCLRVLEEKRADAAHAEDPQGR